MTQVKLPAGWASAPLSEVADINPGSFSKPPQDDDSVSFVPMAAVEEESGRLDPSTHRPWLEVKKGYTLFQDGDVLFAKVTPCMENGKAALAARLKGGRGAGSTEFFVLRSRGGVDPKYLMHFVLQSSFRRDARAAMQGVAGLLRVRKEFMQTVQVPVAPMPEQRRIVAEIEKQFTRLDAGVEAFKRVQAQLKRYRASVLKAACEGRLVPTEAELARREKRDYEPADKLLARILKERRARWEADQLAKMKASGKLPKDDKWKAKYVEPSSAKAAGLHPLPEGWTWARWEQVGFSQNGRPFPSKDYSESGTKLLRPGNMHVSGRLLWTTDNTRYMPESYANENPDLIVGGNELVINLTAQSLKDEFLGRVCLTPPDEHCLLNQRLARLTPVLLDQRFCLWLFKAWAFRRFVDELNTGSLIQHMFTTQIADFLVAMPPLAEQLRIAEEVERRLSVVEQLEMTADAATLRSSTLRAATLRCAFEGLLVPQDPRDEPASKLLERISAVVENKPLPKQSRAKQTTVIPKMKAPR